MKRPHNKASFLAGKKAMAMGNKRLQQKRLEASKRAVAVATAKAKEAVQQTAPHVQQVQKVNTAPLELKPLTEQEKEGYLETVLDFITNWKELVTSVATGKKYAKNRSAELFPVTAVDVQNAISEEDYKKAEEATKFKLFLYWKKEKQKLKQEGKDYRELEALLDNIEGTLLEAVTNKDNYLTDSIKFFCKKTGEALAEAEKQLGAQRSLQAETSTQETAPEGKLAIAKEEARVAERKSKKSYFAVPNLLKQQLSAIALQYGAKEALLSVPDVNASTLTNSKALFENVLTYFSQRLYEECEKRGGVQLDALAPALIKEGCGEEQGVYNVEVEFEKFGGKAPRLTAPITIEIAELCKFVYGEDQTYNRTAVKDVLRVIDSARVAIRGVDGKINLNVPIAKAFGEVEVIQGKREFWRILLTPIFTDLTAGFTELPTNASERIKPFCSCIREGYSFPTGETFLLLFFLATKRNSWNLHNCKLKRAKSPLLPKCEVVITAKELAEVLLLEKLWNNNTAKASRRVEELLQLFELAGVIELKNMKRVVNRKGTSVLAEVTLIIKETFWRGSVVIEAKATDSPNTLPAPAVKSEETQVEEKSVAL